LCDICMNGVIESTENATTPVTEVESRRNHSLLSGLITFGVVAVVVVVVIIAVIACCLL